MKKALRILGLGAVAVIGTAGLAACGGDDSADLTIGMVCIGDPANSTYDGNFKNALEDTKAAYKAQGYNIKTLYKSNVGEKAEARAAAEELAEDCDIVLLDSYGHQNWGYEVAQANPNVKFVSCTGDTAAVKQIPNFYNAFANIYEGRYLAGIVAGMKLNSIGSTAADHVLGYVAAFPYAEVVSGYTAFYLGAKSVCADVTMKTVVTKSWGNAEREQTGAEKLIAAGCKVISQHADTYGAPNACAAANPKVPNVSYNVSANGGNLADSYLCSSRINWTPYFNYVVDCVKNSKTIAYDWTGGLKEGSVVVGELGSCAAEGTKAAMDTAETAIKAGTLNVFDTSKFTASVANNQYANITVDSDGHVTSYLADVIPDAAYTGDTEVVSNGVIKESSKRSAPYFNINVDGISCIDAGDQYKE